ncbi:MAG TPA: type VI secretion system protein [Anaeromyxobacteraceae bacterium]|nr:type VI secretion system protein [Anaeromyxobacteraceae bacterium]
MGSSALPLSRPALVAAAAGAAALGLGLSALPLVGVPGWELGELAALFSAVAGAPLGIAAARRELGREIPSPWRAAAGAAAAALLLSAALVAPPFVRAAFSPCSAAAGAAFVPLLALPSALAGSALGAAAGLAARGRRRRAALLFAGAVLCSLSASLLAAWGGPAAYVLDHLLGAWPGPLYDEALALDERLVLFRLGTLAWAAALAAAAELGLRLARRRPARAAAAALGLALLAYAGLEAALLVRGDLASRAFVASALGGESAGERCRLLYPAEKAPWEVDGLARDCEFEAAEVAAALGLGDPRRVSVYLYRDAAEKRRLVGAGHTDYTKPWLAEVHLTWAPSPHPSLRHELTHALAAPLARGPLGVPARWLVSVQAGLVEGLAVAIDLPRGDWTVHEWTRAMRDLGLMPGASELLGPAGFLSAPKARAYTVAGSFLAYLLQRHGPGPVRRIYGGDSFQAAFGRPMDALEGEWSAFLDGVAVPPELRASAEARFRTEGLLGRRCAREVAGLEARAAEAAWRGRAAEAAAAWRRASEISGDPGDLLAAGEALRRGGDESGARRTFAEALAAAGDGRPQLRGALLGALGDLDWLAGDRAGAAARYRAALAERPERAAARLLQAKLEALEAPGLEAAVGPFLLGRGDPSVALARLAGSGAPLSEYLAGRAYLARGAPRLALPRLERALAGRLPSPDFELEARRLAAEARCASGDFEGGAAAFAALARTAEREAERERALSASRRCDFERRRRTSPPEAPADWPPQRSTRGGLGNGP